MILFSIYFLLIGFLIYRYGFFGLLKDEVLNPKFYLTAFAVKISGLAAFYVVYTKMYGGIHYSDTYHYFQDSKILNSVAHWKFSEFVKLMFGFQDESETSELFTKFLRFTEVWDENKEEFLYNDNRLMLRFHALIHFISFGNYFVHALVSGVVALIGINWIYRTFKFLFEGKEILFFSLWLLFPGLWFWSSALFKEGPALFCMGLMLISQKRWIADKNYSIKNTVLLLISFVLCFVFKQYVMVPICMLSVLFFIFCFKFPNLKYRGLIYIVVLISILLIGNYGLGLVQHKSAIALLAERQKAFIDMSNGGLFLLNDKKFVRLPYDTTTISKTRLYNGKVQYVKINPGTKYMYWELKHQQDTLICKNNTDTSEFMLYYSIKKANTSIQVMPLEDSYSSLFKAAPQALYITLAKPFFLDARNMMDIMTSIENVFLLLSVLVLLYFALVKKYRNPWLVYLLSIVLLILLIIGITSPNIGAIQRYRSLIVPFLLMAALLPLPLKDPELTGKFFKNRPNN